MKISEIKIGETYTNGRDSKFVENIYTQSVHEFQKHFDKKVVEYNGGNIMLLLSFARWAKLKLDQN